MILIVNCHSPIPRPRLTSVDLIHPTSLPASCHASRLLSRKPLPRPDSRVYPVRLEGRAPQGEVSEQEIIDHPWVQRMRHIHQLQTAWWVFPSAEHNRFQHVLGAMHLASRVMEQWYDSLKESCPNVPSRGYVESLARMAALLHDVGHGPFGHFFDDQYLDQFGITHEDIGARIIEQELGDLLRGIRRNPNGSLQPLEEIDPKQVRF